MPEPKVIRIDASDLDGCMDNGEYPESIAEAIEAALEVMRADPGTTEPATIQLVISNDFEPNEDEDEEESESEDQPTKE